MTLHRPINTAAWTWACAGMLFSTLAGQTANAADIGYPPPPGDYHSEPSVWFDMPRTPAPGEQAGSIDASVTPSAQRPPEFPEPAQRPRTDDPAPPHFMPPAYAGRQDPGHRDFSTEFSRGSQRPPMSQGYQRPGGQAYPGYPAYAPAYPDFRRYPGTYHSGRTTNYAPTPASQGYPSYRMDPDALARQQADGGVSTQGYDPGVPPAAPGFAPEEIFAPGPDGARAAVSYPDAVERTLFRPMD